jgi:hypothetical protein
MFINKHAAVQVSMIFFHVVSHLKKKNRIVRSQLFFSCRFNQSFNLIQGLMNFKPGWVFHGCALGYWID